MEDWEKQGWVIREAKKTKGGRKGATVQTCKLYVFKMMEKLRYYPCPKALRALLCEAASEISLNIVLWQ